MELIKTLSSKRAFTLMELLIVIAIIASLAVAFLPSALKAPAKARDVVRIKTVQDIQTAVESYMVERGRLPDSAGDNNCLTAGIATGMGLSTKPTDPTGLNSCGVAGNANDYFYRVVSGDGVPFYVIGVKVEVNTTANSRNVDLMKLKEVSTKDVAQGLIQANPPSDATYFLAVGPV